MRATWCIDDLMRAYLSGDAPERFVLLDAVTLIEVRGARGSFHLTRLDAATFAFRAALAAGRTVGAAAEAALTVDADLDPGHALRALVDAGLATRAAIGRQELPR